MKTSNVIPPKDWTINIRFGWQKSLNFFIEIRKACESISIGKELWIKDEEIQWMCKWVQSHARGRGSHGRKRWKNRKKNATKPDAETTCNYARSSRVPCSCDAIIQRLCLFTCTNSSNFSSPPDAIINLYFAEHFAHHSWNITYYYTTRCKYNCLFRSRSACGDAVTAQ